MLISHIICIYLVYYLVIINILISDCVFYGNYFEYSSRLSFISFISGHRPLISSLEKEKKKRKPYYLRTNH